MNESNSNRKEEYHFDKQMTGAKSLEILPPYYSSSLTSSNCEKNIIIERIKRFMPKGVTFANP